jgi:hypothetical protein
LQQSLTEGEKIRIIIEEESNLIVLTVFQMSDWKEILQCPTLDSLKDYSFYFELKSIILKRHLWQNTYYIHYVRKIRADKEFWFMWKDGNKTILILQVFYSIEFKKIFKELKLKMFLKDKF